MNTLTKNSAIDLDSVVTATNDQISAHLDDEVVILGYQSGAYYGLDEVGLFIWDLLQEPQKVSNICQAVLQEYDVQPADCERDVLTFLADLKSKQLVAVT
ncbi:MAG: PqqD family peptide modification chaperone [Caldilineaceae bacterium]